MKSIINQSIELTLKFSEDKEEKFTIEDISLDDEFEIDFLFNKMVKSKLGEGGLYDDALNLFGKEGLKELGVFGKRVVKELCDHSIMSAATTFINIIYEIQNYKYDLKKK